MAILAIRILIGHLIGDFLLQTNVIAKRKLKDWRYLVLHIALVFTAMVLCTGGYWSWKLILALAIISIMHLIDVLKRDRLQSISWFIGDQFFHLISIAIIPGLFGIWPITSLCRVLGIIYNDPRLWVYILGYLAGVWGGSIIIGMILGSIKRPDFVEAPVSPLASKIGIVERLIVITLALFNQYTAIGIVFAIKGVARKTYVECNDFQGEIYFLGTGLSFTIAILSAVLINFLLKVVV